MSRWHSAIKHLFIPFSVYFSFILFHHAWATVSWRRDVKAVEKCFKYSLWKSQETFCKSMATHGVEWWWFWKSCKGMRFIVDFHYQIWRYINNRISKSQKSSKEIAKMTKKSELKNRHIEIGKLLVNHQLKSILTHQPFLNNLKLKSIKSWMLIKNY